MLLHAPPDTHLILICSPCLTYCPTIVSPFLLFFPSFLKLALLFYLICKLMIQTPLWGNILTRKWKNKPERECTHLQSIQGCITCLYCSDRQGETQLWLQSHNHLLVLLLLLAVKNSHRQPVDRPQCRQLVTSAHTKQDVWTQAQRSWCKKRFWNMKPID